MDGVGQLTCPGCLEDDRWQSLIYFYIGQKNSLFYASSTQSASTLCQHYHKRLNRFGEILPLLAEFFDLKRKTKNFPAFQHKWTAATSPSPLKNPWTLKPSSALELCHTPSFSSIVHLAEATLKSFTTLRFASQRRLHSPDTNSFPWTQILMVHSPFYLNLTM